MAMAQALEVAPHTKWTIMSEVFGQEKWSSSSLLLATQLVLETFGDFHTWSCRMEAVMFQIIILYEAGLGGSFGCAVRLETRRLRVQPPPRSATFFRGD